MKKLIFILPLLYYSCTDDIIADIDALQTENVEQDAQIDSLLTVLTEQQAYIDSLNDAQNIADSLNNLIMQSYIDSLINGGELTDSLLQVYTDSLNTVQNTLNADQQAYIDSLINLGNVSDSLLQVYTDSLNTVQNTLNADQQAYIDSLNGVQQTLIDVLISTAPSTGENYVRIDSLQIVWGDTTFSSQTWLITVNIPIPFITPPSISYATEREKIINVISTINSFSLSGGNWSGLLIHHPLYWTAIGKWQ